MARLWIVLLVIWYRAFTLAKSELTNEIGVETKPGDNSIYKMLRRKRSYDTTTEQNFSTNPPELINYDEKIKDDIPDLDMYDECLNVVNKRKFNSWGGKRSFDDQYLIDCINLLGEDLLDDEFSRNKMSFHSWGGKRSEDPLTPKRLPFRAWGGKRDNSIEARTPKRLPFKAWGGKRSPEEFAYPTYSILDEPRIDREAILALTKNYPEQNEKRVNRKKTKFHSWGGKRSYDEGLQDSILIDPMEEMILKDINGVGRRRLKFNSWGGKRYEPIEDKRTFHSWGGKRNIDDEDSYDTNKRTFHSWGGK